MKVVFYILMLLVGFVALIKGADWFVDGSAAVARKFRVPGVIIGLTIVAMGTSAPELAVSTSAAIQGSNEIAFSNVMGSNFFNLLMVLGICAIIHDVPVDRVIVKRDYPVNLGITAILIGFVLIPPMLNGSIWDKGMLEEAGTVSRIAGITFLVIFVIYIYFLIREAKKNRTEEDENDEKKNMPVWKCVVLILVGIGCIVGGGEAVVYGAKNIALTAGMSETLVGLTIVALGTSLPELVTSIVAARKGQVGMAVGNVIGSNIFNILLILGVSCTIHPIGVNLAGIYDSIILLVVSLGVAIFCSHKETEADGTQVMKINRREGIAMVAMYVADMIFAIVR